MRFSTVVASLEYLELPRELSEANRLVEPGGAVHLLGVVPERHVAAAALRDMFEELRARASLRPAHASLAIHARRGERDEETLRLALESNADLIVIGAFEPESARVASHVLEHAACSVLILAPNLERVEADALVPEYSICRACADERSRRRGEWFCDNHRDPSERLFAQLSTVA